MDVVRFVHEQQSVAMTCGKKLGGGNDHARCTLTVHVSASLPPTPSCPTLFTLPRMDPIEDVDEVTGNPLVMLTIVGAFVVPLCAAWRITRRVQSTCVDEQVEPKKTE